MNDIIIMGPDGREYRFPAGTPAAEIAAAMANFSRPGVVPVALPFPVAPPYFPPAPEGPGVGEIDPVWGGILDQYGRRGFWYGDITLDFPDGQIPEEAAPYLYVNEEQDIRYTVGNRSVPYGVRATHNKMPFENIVLHGTGRSRTEGAYIHNGNVNDGGDYIGYHFIITRDGQVVQVAPLTVRTNGAVGYGDFVNVNSVHIALTGDGNHTDAQINSMTELVNTVATQYGISPDRITTHGYIQDNRDQERNNPALQQVMENVGAPIPLLTVDSGGEWGARDDAGNLIRMAQGYLGVTQPEGNPGQPYYTGPVDGDFGPGMQDAIGQWQAARGLVQSGYIDAETARLMIEEGFSTYAPALWERWLALSR